jgi:hypothetical protein
MEIIRHIVSGPNSSMCLLSALIDYEKFKDMIKATPHQKTKLEPYEEILEPTLQSTALEGSDVGKKLFFTAIRCCSCHRHDIEKGNQLLNLWLAKNLKQSGSAWNL